MHWINCFFRLSKGSTIPLDWINKSIMALLGIDIVILIKIVTCNIFPQIGVMNGTPEHEYAAMTGAKIQGEP